MATVVLDLLINGASWVVDNWSWLSPVIYGVAAALGVYYGAQLAANTVGLISKGVHIAMARQNDSVGRYGRFDCGHRR